MAEHSYDLLEDMEEEREQTLDLCNEIAAD
jgi:hypothetical protein